VERPKFVGASVSELLADLKSPEPYTRQQAKRVLAEHDGGEVAAALAAFLPTLDAADPLIERHKLEALWAYEGIDKVETKLLAELLGSKDGRVRAAAVRTLSHWHDQLPEGREWLAKSVADETPRVRLEAIRALADYPSIESFHLALSALDKPRDRFIDYALWLTTKDLQSVMATGGRGRVAEVAGKEAGVRFAGDRVQGCAQAAAGGVGHGKPFGGGPGGGDGIHREQRRARGLGSRL